MRTDALRRGRRSLKTALLQILPGNSLEENLEKGLFWCREAKKAGADLALFPEMWSSGYDIPESARILMLMGAEIVLVPNACPMEINRLSQLRGRAYENMMGIATCNYSQGKPDCNGHSSAFDGVAYLPGEEGLRDMCILEADGEEGLWLAEFDLELLRSYRRQEETLSNQNRCQ